ncbi:MAG: LLM class F420-dependent oxidoreductase [Thermodesulfobacteriota bacterium]
MKFGIVIPLHRDVNALVNLELAIKAEMLGFDSIWISDHVVLPTKYEGRFSKVLYDPFVLLASIAAKTKKISLGTSVLILPYRNPIVVAKMVSTIDVLSDGRVIFGVGPGWMEEEFDVLGIPFNERGKRADEYINIFKELWVKDEPQFDGEFYSFSKIRFYPKPIQKPHPPIWIGGISKRAIARAVELGDGWHPVWLGPDQMEEKIGYLRRVAEEKKRNLDNFVFSIRSRLRILKTTEVKKPDFSESRGEYTFSFHGTIEEIIHKVRQFESIGVSHIMFDLDVEDDNEMFKTIEQFSKDIMPSLRK